METALPKGLNTIHTNTTDRVVITKQLSTDGQSGRAFGDAYSSRIDESGSPATCSRDEVTKRTVLKSTVVGHFAMWAVRQSPYLHPDNLEDGIKEFNTILGSTGVFIETTCANLETIVGDAIMLSKTVMSWNNAKEGNGDDHIFVSCYHSPDPDLDFIDIGAMARNIAHSVWLEVCYDDGDLFHGTS